MKVKCENCGKEIDARGIRNHTKSCTKFVSESKSEHNEFVQDGEEKGEEKEFVQNRTAQTQNDIQNSSQDDTKNTKINTNFVALLAVLAIIVIGILAFIKKIRGTNND